MLVAVIVGGLVFVNGSDAPTDGLISMVILVFTATGETGKEILHWSFCSMAPAEQVVLPDVVK